MLKRIKSLLLGNIIWIAVLVTIGIAYLSLIRTSNFPSVNIIHLDKLYHAFAYFVLTFCWLLSIKKQKKSTKYIIAFACIIYGIIIEVLQTKLTMYRTGDFLDFLANTFGIVLALLIFNQFFVKNQFN